MNKEIDTTLTEMKPFFLEGLERKVLKWVVANDDVCIHSILYEGVPCSVVMLPEFIIRPASKNNEKEFSVKCPVCEKEYEKATELLEEEFGFFLSGTPGDSHDMQTS